MPIPATGLSSTHLRELMKKCQDNLFRLARDYKKAGQHNETIEYLIEERDKEIQKIMSRYESKIEEARGNSPEVQQIRQEIIRQVKSFEGFKQTLALIGFPDATKSNLKIPTEIKDLVDSLTTQTHATYPEISRLPMEDFRPYRTIEESIKEMFHEIENSPMKPKQIIEYLVKQKHIPQAEASIRTQLHNLKNNNKVSYNGTTKTYQWNFSEAEKANLRENKISR